MSCHGGAYSSFLLAHASIIRLFSKTSDFFSSPWSHGLSRNTLRLGKWLEIVARTARRTAFMFYGILPGGMSVRLTICWSAWSARSFQRFFRALISSIT